MPLYTSIRLLGAFSTCNAWRSTATWHRSKSCTQNAHRREFSDCDGQGEEAPTVKAGRPQMAHVVASDGKTQFNTPFRRRFHAKREVRPRCTGAPPVRQRDRADTGRSSRDSVNQKSLPFPSSLSTPTSPPSDEMMCLTMARPRPVPPEARLRSLCTR